MKKIWVITFLLGSLTISACETIAGAGRDIQKGGAAIQRAAD